MNILLAHDGSPSADLALKLGASLAGSPDLAIEILRVHTPLGADIELPPGTYVELHQRLRQEAADQLGATAQSLAGPGRRVTTALKEGRPASVIVAEARRIAADLVLMGSRGRGPIASALLGSVAAEVVDQSPCPVLVARGPGIRGIVLAEDGSDGARKAEEAIGRWPFLRGLPVRVVSVVDTAAIGAEPSGYGGSEQVFRVLDEACQRLATEGTARLVALGVKAASEVRVGFVGSELIDAARQASADLIVAGSRGRTGIARLVLGSVARTILQQAPCSVLIVREQVAEPARS